ncbi:uncharacterized protein LOC124432348 [Vespa crabro]|uniref:uncharacterized protein LOC124432348 n=1 Tax=Vespa crabro TaxID=7445 RepID=UPI001F0069D8|nr:uncharacterized protein LOC124432348 [Vespa crabro]
MYNMCLRESFFPVPGKKARLVLIGKGNGPTDAASSYRPICMLDTAAMILSKLPRPRLHAAVRAADDVAARQYEFRSGLSTIHAIQEVVTVAKMTAQESSISHFVSAGQLKHENSFNSSSERYSGDSRTYTTLDLEIFRLVMGQLCERLSTNAVVGLGNISTIRGKNMQLSWERMLHSGMEIFRLVEGNLFELYCN